MVTGSATMSVRSGCWRKRCIPGSRLRAFAARSSCERADWRSSWPGFAALGIFSAVTMAADGYHDAAGEAHAEVNAIRKAGDAARGGTLYTTLEPCAHHGRTPPCIDAIREAGVERVVVAMRDPDPRTDGKGIRGLRAAGVEVEEGVLRDEAERLNAGFVSRIKRGRPSVLLKLAVTVDGRVAVPGRRY